MREDDLRNRAGHGSANLAAVRRLAAGIVRLADDKLSFRRRLLKAAQAQDCRFVLIRKAAGPDSPKKLMCDSPVSCGSFVYTFALRQTRGSSKRLQMKSRPDRRGEAGL